MKTQKNRVIILGLDGGTWKIFNPLMQMGIMPNLKKIIEGGVSGNLESTISPATATAWATFQTGVNPGKHGIYDFVMHNQQTHNNHFVTSSDIPLKTIWELVSDLNKTAISINVPLTYPPKKINGATISCLLSPYTYLQESCIYPAKGYQDLIDKIGEYIIFVDPKIYLKKGYKHFIDECIYAEKKRIEAAMYLMNKYDWDLLMVHNQSLDNIQHKLWHCIDKNNENLNLQINQYVMKFYKALDENIGALLENIDNKTTVVLLSDHGFGPINRHINLHSWLLEKEYLVLKKSYKFKKFGIQAVRLLDFFNFRNKLLSFKQKVQFQNNIYNNFMYDWKKVKAYIAGESIYSLLYLNSKDKKEKSIKMDEEYKKIRNQIREELMCLKDTITNESAIKDVLYKEDVYHGMYTDYAPDLIVVPKEGYAFSQRPILMKNDIFYSPDVSKGDNSGTHRMDGMFVFYGNNIKKGIKVDNFRLIDIAPNLLYLLNINTPVYMDGIIRRDIYNIETKTIVSQQSVFEDINKNILENDNSYTADEEKIIEQRLRNLGYM